MTAPAQSFEDLIVWQRAHSLVLSVYSVTQQFPRTEVYGLTSQFRRASVSIPANIAEGFRKRSPADKARYLNIAEASLEECQYYLILAHDLGYLDKGVLWQASKEVGRLLNGYRKAILKSDVDDAKNHR
jgi:four helix bundle protein